MPKKADIEKAKKAVKNTTERKQVEYAGPLKTKETVASKYKPIAKTEAQVIMLSKEITKGMSRARAIEYAMTNFHVGPDQAANYYKAAMRYLLPEDMEEYRKNLCQANIDRLERIIDVAMEKEQWKIAREAIDSLNKMLGIYGGVQVGIKNDPENNTQEFIIKISD